MLELNLRNIGFTTLVAVFLVLFFMVASTMDVIYSVVDCWCISPVLELDRSRLITMAILLLSIDLMFPIMSIHEIFATKQERVLLNSFHAILTDGHLVSQLHLSTALGIPSLPLFLRTARERHAKFNIDTKTGAVFYDPNPINISLSEEKTCVNCSEPGISSEDQVFRCQICNYLNGFCVVCGIRHGISDEFCRYCGSNQIMEPDPWVPDSSEFNGEFANDILLSTSSEEGETTFICNRSPENESSATYHFTWEKPDTGVTFHQITCPNCKLAEVIMVKSDRYRKGVRRQNRKKAIVFEFYLVLVQIQVYLMFQLFPHRSHIVEFYIGTLAISLITALFASVAIIFPISDHEVLVTLQQGFHTITVPPASGDKSVLRK